MNPIEHIKAFFSRRLQSKRDKDTHVNEEVNHVRNIPPLPSEIMNMKFSRPTQRNSSPLSRYVPLDNNNMATVDHMLLMNASIRPNINSPDSGNHSSHYNDCSDSYSLDTGHSNVSHSTHSYDNTSYYSDSYSNDSSSSSCD